MEVDQLARAIHSSGGASSAAARAGGGDGGSDGANAKRKLETSAASSAPVCSVLTCSALSSPAGDYDATTCHPWTCSAGTNNGVAGDGGDAMDSQPKVRRRGSCMEPSAPNMTMKRCCSEGKIPRTLGTLAATSTDALGCPVSPSMTVLRAAQGKSGSPRQPDCCWSPSARSPRATKGSPTPSVGGQTRPGLDQVVESSTFLLPLATQSPSVKNNDPLQPPQSGWSPSVASRSQAGLPSPHNLTPAPPPTYPAAMHGSTATMHPKRTWPPRRSRNPGNLSLDMSQVDQSVPESLSATNQRNDQAAVCSKLTDFLFIGGAVAAKDKDTLTQAGITHIINCAASVAPAFYPSEFSYYNLRLRDHSTQDIACHFYTVFDFIERARMRGGRIFVHCVKGISRSPTMAIAYLMWYKRIGMYQALEFVRQARPAVDPNAGFIFQLTEWEQLHLKGKIQLHRPIVFRIEVTSRENSAGGNSASNSCGGDSIGGNGARPAERPLIVGPLLDIEEQFFHHPSDEVAASSFIVACSDYMFIWCGQSASEQQVEAAQTASELLQAYESFPAKCDLLYEGRETPAFWNLLGEAAPPDN